MCTLASYHTQASAPLLVHGQAKSKIVVVPEPGASVLCLSEPAAHSSLQGIGKAALCYTTLQYWEPREGEGLLSGSRRTGGLRVALVSYERETQRRRFIRSASAVLGNVMTQPL
ncbi:hypothetical protein NDU88_003368 [Pleurodeles waltl]|uniref:Uncharacterized protein n=1 Tax=Pleurodeles waltl TaxID=8319 RepID=A0AAV7L1M8_PLEWA|nr:hypothetical protein NDU88_003368 [Pleurodeles waltl]